MLLLLSLLSCTTSPDPVNESPPPPLDPAIVAKIDPHRIKAHTEFLCDDALGGRISGSAGSKTAREYLIEQMTEIGLEPGGTNGGYAAAYSNEPFPNRFELTAEGVVVPHDSDTGYNLIGVLPGSDPDLAREYMVVMAHYDHLGVTEEGDVFNGAFDNAAAVGMNLEIARTLIDNDAAPGRSTLFLITDDEESGLDGANAWIGSPTIAREDIVFGVSTDPLGRRMLPDFAPIVLIGLERSPGLRSRWEEAAAFTDSAVYFINRDVIPVFASDQDEFFEASTPVPALWFTNVGFTWYHTTGDTAETIDYRMVLEDANLLAQALTLIGNSEERFDYEGPKEPKAVAAQEAKTLILDMFESEYPSGNDREFAQFYLDQLDAIIEADSQDVVLDAEALYIGTLYFMLFDMPAKFPGEVPPPWPEGW